VYDLADIMAALTDDGNSDTTLTPLPAMFAITSQTFNCRLERPAPGPMDSRWSSSTYLSVAISADGKTHAVTSRDGVNDFTGFVNWYTDGALQKFDLTNSSRQVQYSFDVLAYDRNHLRLQMLWGAEMKEWLYSAGTNNLSGVVLSATDFVQVGFNLYYAPIAGATVQFGSYTSSFVPDSSVAECTTDSAGYFALSDLNLPGGYQACVRVVKAGYADQTQVLLPHLPQVSLTANAFVSISMTPQ
jgi:hypothetical protein